MDRWEKMGTEVQYLMQNTQKNKRQSARNRHVAHLVHKRHYVHGINVCRQFVHAAEIPRRHSALLSGSKMRLPQKSKTSLNRSHRAPQTSTSGINTTTSFCPYSSICTAQNPFTVVFGGGGGSERERERERERENSTPTCFVHTIIVFGKLADLSMGVCIQAVKAHLSIRGQREVNSAYSPNIHFRLTLPTQMTTDWVILDSWRPFNRQGPGLGKTQVTNHTLKFFSKKKAHSYRHNTT